LQIIEILTVKKKELKLTKKSIETIALLLGKSDMIEYESISFGRMSEKKFHEYIKEQIPWLYSEVIGRFFKDEAYDEKIAKIEKEYKKFFTKLNKV
jgi:hypothetical protein